MRAAWLALALLPLAATGARAGDGVFSEVRLGAYVHDLGQVEHGADLGAELLFVSPVPDAVGSGLPPWVRWALHPRPHLGAEINTSGYTSQGYFGLTWTATLLPAVVGHSDSLFASFDFGPSFNDGHVRNGGSRYDNLGSNVLFRLGFGLGYRITPRLSVIASFDHESNAGLARENEGLNNAGVRLGLRF